MAIIAIILMGMLVIGLFYMLVGNDRERRKAKSVFAFGAAGVTAVFLLSGGAGLIFSTVGLFATAMLGAVYVFIKFMR